jgi:hypothetical protein
VTSVGFLIIALGVLLARQAVKGRATNLPEDTRDFLLAFFTGDNTALAEVASRTGEGVHTDPDAPPRNIGTGSSALLDTAVRLGNAASGGYVWGATGPDSYDCSGLVWAAAKDIGVYSGNRFTTSTFRSVASGWATETNSPAVGDIVVWPGKHMGIVAGSDRYYSARSTKKGIGYATLTGDNNYFGISPEYWRVNQQWVNRQA